MRKTPQKPGERTQAFDRTQWREVSWDEALDYAADRLVEIYRRDGADAMAVYCCAKATNEDNYLLQKLFRVAVPHQQCRSLHPPVPCRLGGGAASMALGSSAMSNTAAEVIQERRFSRHRLQHRRDPPDHRAANEGGGGQARRQADRHRPAPAWSWWTMPTLWLPLEAGHRRAALFRAWRTSSSRNGFTTKILSSERTEGFDEFVGVAGKIHARIRRGDFGRRPQSDRRRRPACMRRPKNAAPSIGAGHSRSIGPRHRQRAVADSSGAAHRPHRPRRHGPQPAARAEQRAGRVRLRRHALALIPAIMRVDDEAAARKFEKAWNIEPGGAQPQAAG